MGGIVVMGAQGHVGRAAIARLETLGHELAAEGDASAAMVLDLRPPSDDRRSRWAAAAQAGQHVLAASLDADDVVWAKQEWDQAATERGVVLAPCSGAAAVLGDLLGTLAARASGGASEVHTAHLVAERGGLLRVATPGLRAELAALIGKPVRVREDGALVVEPLAERRRLAWFARPVGPHHAATVPAPEVITLPWHQPDAALVTGQLAMSGARSELVQGLGNLAAHSSRSRAWLSARIARDGRPAGAMATARWASVGEALGPAGVARAWANGRDLQNLTGEVVAHLADRVLSTGARGVLAPAQLEEPGDVLDALTERTDLRWAVVRPTADDPLSG